MGDRYNTDNTRKIQSLFLATKNKGEQQKALHTQNKLSKG